MGKPRHRKLSGLPRVLTGVSTLSHACSWQCQWLPDCEILGYHLLSLSLSFTTSKMTRLDERTSVMPHFPPKPSHILKTKHHTHMNQHTHICSSICKTETSHSLTAFVFSRDPLVHHTVYFSSVRLQNFLCSHAWPHAAFWPAGPCWW